MFHYIEDKTFVDRARKKCSEILKKLEDELRLSKKINTQYFLIGSGARNMVTQNENGPIDFDFNLNIISCSNINDGKSIKEAVRLSFNKVLSSYDLVDCDDSTSSLTTKKIYFTDSPDIEFSIDLAIVTEDKNNWYRLIHDKRSIPNKYFWNEAPKSKKYADKVKKIKTIPGAWDKVRLEYIKIKNNYLRHNDNNHPSFICYIESVNNVYNHLIQTKRI